jgi:dihydroflavonol-4-reductase
MIFVTGATGLIGSFLLRELRARGLAVRALHRGALPADALPGVEWVQGDILDYTLLTSAISPEVTHVFHCAGLVSYAPQDEDALLQVNVRGDSRCGRCLLGSAWHPVGVCVVGSGARAAHRRARATY